VRLATIRDHIVPLAEGGQDIESNVQPLCQTCSDIKTQAEAARGRHRADGDPDATADVTPETASGDSDGIRWA
jgi:5-methylcytosine-specific restriction endonuclease McrA